MSSGKNKHDKAVDELELLVRDQYQIIMKNVIYRMPPSRNEAGELDLIGINGDCWDIYEVKSNDGYEKAVSQLERAYLLLGDCAEIRTFYYSGKEKKIVPIHYHKNQKICFEANLLVFIKLRITKDYKLYKQLENG